VKFKPGSNEVADLLNGSVGEFGRNNSTDEKNNNQPFRKRKSKKKGGG